MPGSDSEKSLSPYDPNTTYDQSAGWENPSKRRRIRKSDSFGNESGLDSDAGLSTASEQEETDATDMSSVQAVIKRMGLDHRLTVKSVASDGSGSMELATSGTGYIPFNEVEHPFSQETPTLYRIDLSSRKSINAKIARDEAEAKEAEWRFRTMTQAKPKHKDSEGESQNDSGASSAQGAHEMLGSVRSESMERMLSQSTEPRASSGESKPSTVITANRSVDPTGSEHGYVPDIDTVQGKRRLQEEEELYRLIPELKVSEVVSAIGVYVERDLVQEGQSLGRALAALGQPPDGNELSPSWSRVIEDTFQIDAAAYLRNAVNLPMNGREMVILRHRAFFRIYTSAVTDGLNNLGPGFSPELTQNVNIRLWEIMDESLHEFEPNVDQKDLRALIARVN